MGRNDLGSIGELSKPIAGPFIMWDQCRSPRQVFVPSIRIDHGERWVH